MIGSDTFYESSNLYLTTSLLQGFFIFLFYVLLKEDTRKFWLQKFKRKKKSPVISNTGAGSNDKGTLNVRAYFF